ncbi:hypothetical protein EC988_001828 [Linderina pennispora]|nr:hypothetical protein EC988_001828 [Linderina pennispora]
MSSHVYFLIDRRAVGHSQGAVGTALAQILVYLAAQHQCISWNYELVDLESRPKPTTAQHKRSVRERKAIDVETVDKFLAEMHQMPNDSLPAPVCAPIETLHARLMCLEADVEWGDPATMRSPARNNQTRTWTDPSRINESMSVQKYMIVVGSAPGSLAALRDFVRGPAMHTESQDDVSLIEQLTELRDGVIGKGLWESYARKRVGITFVSMAPKRAIPGMDPVDILIESVFESCFESLGGCVVPVTSLLVRGLPFSAAFSLWHRRRTYPSWSRKFAREVSAVIDRFSEEVDEEPHREWSLAMDGVQTTVRLRQLPIPERQWLTEGRLHRRYDLAEMVAAVSDYKQAYVAKDGDSGCRSVLTAIGTAPLSMWLRIVRAVGTVPPIYCNIDRGQLPKCSITICRCSVPAAPEPMKSWVLFQPAAAVQSYPLALVVPVSNHTAAIYYISDITYAYISDIISEYDEQRVVDPTDPPSGHFEPSWMESWCWKDTAYDFPVQPLDRCSVDVGFYESEFDCSLLESKGIASALSSPVHVQNPTGRDDPDIQSWGSADVENADTRITSLELWYSNVYLKTVTDTSLAFDRVLDTLEPLCLSDDGDKASTLNRFAHDILLTSTDIGDFFVAGRSGSFDNAFQEMRINVAKEIPDNSTQQQYSWQLQECRVQILLHLFVLDYARSHNKDLVNGHTRETLLEALRDLVDQLCIWASLDDVPISPISSTTSTTGNLSRSDSLSSITIDAPSDLAGAFISSPCMAQFDDTLCDVLEELRIQCGWVPADRTDGAQATLAAMSPDSKRRKGTPRRLRSSHSMPKSEVIVLQRQNKVQAGISGRRLARHLDELISSKKPKLEEAVTSEPRSSGSADGFGRLQATRKLPSHLLRKIKSEVVSTTQRAPSTNHIPNAQTRAKR